MKRTALLVSVLLMVAGLGSCAKKTPALNLLVWEGYADPSFVKGFEEQCQCKVSASYMSTSDELVAKLRGGSASTYDVISPSSDVATMIAAAGLAAPLDGARVRQRQGSGQGWRRPRAGTAVSRAIVRPSPRRPPKPPVSGGFFVVFLRVSPHAPGWENCRPLAGHRRDALLHDRLLRRLSWTLVPGA